MEESLPSESSTPIQPELQAKEASSQAAPQPQLPRAPVLESSTPLPTRSLDAPKKSVTMAPGIQHLDGSASFHPMEKSGTLNGFAGHPRSSSSQLGNMRKSMRSSGRFSISSVEDTTVTLQRRIAKELGSSVSERVTTVDYNALVEWIHYERLMSLPKEGSAWDKVRFISSFVVYPLAR